VGFGAIFNIILALCFLLPSIVLYRPPAMLHERKPLDRHAPIYRADRVV
jgi:hypothetical protein